MTNTLLWFCGYKIIIAQLKPEWGGGGNAPPQLILGGQLPPPCPPSGASPVKAVEMKTRDQSNSRLWFRMRAGRITASKFKAVCCTDLSSPSLSLILSICHPNTMRFRTAATSWGCQHEKDALEQYQKTSLHDKANVYPSGFFISSDYPYFGASPDGIVHCFCCGSGICEVKVSEMANFRLPCILKYFTF